MPVRPLAGVQFFFFGVVLELGSWEWEFGRLQRGMTKSFSGEHLRNQWKRCI